eukprot:4239685-Amphidinium_carterae.1
MRLRPCAASVVYSTQSEPAAHNGFTSDTRVVSTFKFVERVIALPEHFFDHAQQQHLLEMMPPKTTRPFF